MYYMGCVKITSLATLLSMRLCLQVVLRHVGDIAASRALHHAFSYGLWNTKASSPPKKLPCSLNDKPQSAFLEPVSIAAAAAKGGGTRGRNPPPPCLRQGREGGRVVRGSGRACCRTRNCLS